MAELPAQVDVVDNVSVPLLRKSPSKRIVIVEKPSQSPPTDTSLEKIKNERRWYHISFMQRNLHNMQNLQHNQVTTESTKNVDNLRHSWHLNGSTEMWVNCSISGVLRGCVMEFSFLCFILRVQPGIFFFGTLIDWEKTHTANF